jgi:hypothetical protein
MLRLPIVTALTLLVCGNWIGANAAAIHKWVDDKGVTHYSDAAPSSLVTSATRLEISTGNTTKTALSTTSDQYYSIANQWQRLQQERLQQQQLELQRAAIYVNRSVEPKRAEDSDELRTARYLVAYPARHHRRHGYPKYRPRPRRGHGYAQQPQRGLIRSSGFLPIN